MRIFDCFMYYNEDVILDLRLNHLNQFVDYFLDNKINNFVI